MFICQKDTGRMGIVRRLTMVQFGSKTILLVWIFFLISYGSGQQLFEHEIPKAQEYVYISIVQKEEDKTLQGFDE